MRTSDLPYDNTSRESILEHALKLKDHSLRDFYEDEVEEGVNRGRSGLGKLVEWLHFRYPPNSDSQPDFPEASVELKTSPIRRTNKGFSPKERLVLNIIDFMSVHKEEFKTSTFLKKNSLLLLMFYLYQQGVSRFDLVFKIVKLWEIPETDIPIIKEDWEKIVGMVQDGRAHEISGGDTNYLEACRKGAGGGVDLRKQPFTDVLALQRAFAYKSSYIRSMIEDEIGELEDALRVDFYEQDISFEQYIIKKFEPFYGKSRNELKLQLNLDYSERSKHKSYLLAKAILGIEQNKKIKEFEKADIQVKTILLRESGKPQESMSFKQIKYDKIVEQKWEDSYFFNRVVNRKYFFVIFKKDSYEIPRLHKVMFWNMPSEIATLAEDYWNDIKEKVRKRDFDNFWKISDDRIFHVRPKARNAKDLKVLKDGTSAKKYAYWINSSYLKTIIG